MGEPADDAVSLLAAARDGSRSSLGRLLEGCRKYLTLVAAEELDPDLRAKGSVSDLVQESFLEAQRDFGQFRGATEAELLGWLRQILRNNVASFTRKFRGTAKRAVGREVALPADDSGGPDLGAAPGLTPGSDAIEREQAAALMAAVERLPEEYRQAVLLHYVEDLTFEAIGERMNRSAEAARKLWSRALARLREEWDQSNAARPGGT